MGVLGKITANTLVHLGAVVSSSTIFLCYAMAVAQGHVKLWLPTISSCGYRPPEEYVFRYGMLTGALSMAVIALYIYTADMPFSGDFINVVSGVMAGLCLGVVGICAYVENKRIHKTSAIIFFILENIVIIRITLQGKGTLSRLSTTMKIVFTILCWISTLLTGLDQHVIFEWSAVMAIIGFNWTFAFDFRQCYFIAVWKNEPPSANIKLHC